MIWGIIYPDRTFISSDDIIATRLLPAFDMSFQPFSITAHESVLTINGTERNNGIMVRCVAYNGTSTPFRRCPGRTVSVMFYQAGMIKLTFASCINLTFVCDEGVVVG